jgi:hypothetical protein
MRTKGKTYLMETFCIYVFLLRMSYACSAACRVKSTGNTNNLSTLVLDTVCTRVFFIIIPWWGISSFGNIPARNDNKMEGLETFCIVESSFLPMVLNTSKISPQTFIHVFFSESFHWGPNRGNLTTMRWFSTVHLLVLYSLVIKRELVVWDQTIHWVFPDLNFRTILSRAWKFRRKINRFGSSMESRIKVSLQVYIQNISHGR